jgi:protein-tyrosine phosphatase
MIDLHAHLLPELDDGPPTMDAAVDMARAAVAAGTEAVVCAPHVGQRWPVTAAAVHAGVAALQARLDRDEVPLRVLPGGEITLEAAARLGDDELRGLSLGGGGRWLLLEFPFVGWPLGLPKMLRDLEIRGFGAVLAHPERAESVQRAPDRLRDLIGRGALVQLTASAFTGEHGSKAQRAAVSLLRGGEAHLLASDAHSAHWRPPGLADGLAAAAAELGTVAQTLDWMVRAGPREVVSGGAVRPPHLVPTRTLRAAVRRASPARPRSRRG